MHARLSKQRLFAIVVSCSVTLERVLQTLLFLEVVPDRISLGSALVDLCPAYTDSLVGCLMHDTNDTFDSCRACVTDSLSLRNGIVPSSSSFPKDESAAVETCQDLESVLCSALSTCPCPSCRHEYAESLFCIMQAKLAQYDGHDQCRFACPNASLEDPPLATSRTSIDPHTDRMESCSLHKIAAARCYVENRLTRTDAAACHSCIVHLLSSDGVPSGECEHQARAVCRAISDCPCDPCHEQEALYWECTVQASQNCTLSSCDIVPRSYFTSTVPSSVSRRRCGDLGNTERLSRR
jgi:hypothetical protein